MKSNKMLKTAGFMAMATLLAKACGLVRDALIAGYFATGPETDAFMTASKLPTMLFDMVIGGVISASFIPIFSSVRQDEGEPNAQKFAGKFITMILSVAVLIAILGIVFSDGLVYLLAPGFTGDKHVLTAQLSSIMFPMIIFTGLAFSFVGLLQSYGEYNVPAVISLISNIAIIAYFPLFADKYGIHGLAYTMLVAWSLQVLVQIPSLIRFKFKYKPSLRLNDKNIKAAIALAVPMLISTWVQPLYSIVNSRLASGIEGAPAVLELANRLYVVMTGVFSFVVTNLVFPKAAKANAENDSEQAKQLIVSSLKSMVLIILPLTIGVMILSKPVTSIIYEHNKFDSESVKRVSEALSFYSVGMLGLAINEVLSKYFFSMKNSKTPMRNSVLSMIFNIALAYLLFRLFKTPGLALAAAGGSICNAALNAFSLRRNGLFKKTDWVSVTKIAVSSALMGVVVWLIYRLTAGIFSPTKIGNLLLCGVCGISGAIVYFVSVIILKVDLIINLFKKTEREE